VTESPPVVSPLARLSNTRVDEAMLRSFWEYIVKRQAIWHARNIAEAPWPWTDDIVLQDYFFGNVYRRLDVGTQYYIANIVGHGTREHEVFNTVAYRVFNNLATWRALVAPKAPNEYLEPTEWRDEGWNVAATALQDYRDAGHKIFTRAYITTGTPFGPYDNQIDNFCWALGRLADRIGDFTRALESAGSAHACYELLRSIEGLGTFLAYQVTQDLSYTAWGYSDGGWVHLGPGSRVALKYILPDWEAYKHGPAFITHLWVNQDRYFDLYGVAEKWQEVNQGPIGLWDIEACLCEWSKYQRTVTGLDPDGMISTKTTRRYTPVGALTGERRSSIRVRQSVVTASPPRSAGEALTRATEVLSNMTKASMQSQVPLVQSYILLAKDLIPPEL
jgi:hypothetical protein